MLALDHDARLTSVVVDLDVDLFGQSALVFHDPALALINGRYFSAGVAVQVELGFAHVQPVFRGEVVALEPQFRRDLPPALQVVCQESIHRLGLSSRSRAFNEVDAKEITTRIAHERGLRADAPSGTKEHLFQGNVSDALFLRQMARGHGNHVRIDGKTLVLGPPPKAAEITVGPGDGLNKMRLRISAAGQVSEVSIHGWDPRAKREIFGRAKAGGHAGGGGSHDHGSGATLSFAGYEHAPADVATAEAMATGRMRKIAEGFATARLEMIGNPSVVPGALLALEKMGAELDGTYRVERVRHEFDRRGYWVNAEVVRLSRKRSGQPARVPGAPRSGAAAREWRPPEPATVVVVRDDGPTRLAGPARADAIPQAETMREAARTGAPFCEKCEAAHKAVEAAAKAAEAERRAQAELAAAKTRATAVTASATAAGATTSRQAATTAAAQAATLRSAAASGAPFCEKCEAAHKAVEAEAKAAEVERQAQAAAGRPD
jgi:phage protein D